jgi:hypothetical protein
MLYDWRQDEQYHRQALQLKIGLKDQIFIYNQGVSLFDVCIIRMRCNQVAQGVKLFSNWHG